MIVYMSIDQIYKALADPSRREILSILKGKDMTVTELKTHFKFTQASLSHHLDILKRARLVIYQRDGQFNRYSLNTSVFEEVIKIVMNLLGGK